MGISVSYRFAKLSDMDLDDFASRIDKSMRRNPVYSSPDVEAMLPVLKAANADFALKIEKAAMGGSIDTAAKNLSRQTLLALLRRLACYVQTTAKDMEQLVSSGFEARSQHRAVWPLEKPERPIIENGVTGQLIGRLRHPVRNSNLYEGRSKADGPWLPSVFTGDWQHIIFDRLTLGVVYTIEVRGLGGLTGQSDWSDPVSHLAK